MCVFFRSIRVLRSLKKHFITPMEAVESKDDAQNLEKHWPFIGKAFCHKMIFIICTFRLEAVIFILGDFMVSRKQPYYNYSYHGKKELEYSIFSSTVYRVSGASPVPSCPSFICPSVRPSSICSLSTFFSKWIGSIGLYSRPIQAKGYWCALHRLFVHLSIQLPISHLCDRSTAHNIWEILFVF